MTHITRTESFTAANGEYGIQRVCNACDWTSTAHSCRDLTARSDIAAAGRAHEKAMYVAEVERIILAHADRAEDIEAHLNGDPCCNPDCEDCEHPVTDWDRAQPLIDDMRGKG